MGLKEKLLYLLFNMRPKKVDFFMLCVSINLMLVLCNLKRAVTRLDLTLEKHYAKQT